jgi:hypothetical protein
LGDKPNQAKVQLINADGTPLVKDLELEVTLAEPHKVCLCMVFISSSQQTHKQTNKHTLEQKQLGKRKRKFLIVTLVIVVKLL